MIVVLLSVQFLMLVLLQLTFGRQCEDALNRLLDAAQIASDWKVGSDKKLFFLSSDNLFINLENDKRLS